MRVALLAVWALCAFGVLGVGTSAAPPVSVPDTVAGNALNAWLKAFDSGDKVQYRAWAVKYRPGQLKDLDDIMQFRAMTGGFDLRKIESSSADKVVALLQEHLSDQFARVAVSIQGDRITSMDLMAIPRPAEFPIAHLSQTALIDATKADAQRAAAADRFSGDVLIAYDGKPVFEQAYGLADRAKRVPNDLDTRFRMGSMNKMFTAVSVLQLVQTGKISLNAPFGTYLTQYPNKEMASQVTIAELLDHTGGTGDIFGPEFDKHRLQLKTLQDYIDLYGRRPLRFKPGSKWEYSNYGFILLGAVIEKVSGQSYYDYVREHVYAPAGMTSTGSEPEDVSMPERSIGYTESPSGNLEPNTNTLPYRGTSAGGGYTTVGDLLKFANALESNKLLNPYYTQLATTAKAKTPGRGTYGYGFGITTYNGTSCFGHTGGAPGMSGDLEICPASHYVIATLANTDPPAAHISDFILNRLPVTP